MEGRRSSILDELGEIENSVERLRKALMRRWLLRPPSDGLKAVESITSSLKLIKHLLREGDEGEVLKSLREIAEENAQTNKEVTLKSVEKIGELSSEIRELRSQLSNVVSAGERVGRAADSLEESMGELSKVLRGINVEDLRRELVSIKESLDALSSRLDALERDVRRLGSI